MKRKLFIVCVIVLIIVSTIIAIIHFNQTSSMFGVENEESGNIVVTAQKAGKNASGMGYITLKEGQKLEVRTNLTDKSYIKIEVLPENVDATTKVLMEEKFSSIDAREFEFPAGKYTIRITAYEGATGTMDIKAK